MGRTGGARTRERILDAATEVMSTLGLAHTTTKQIARAAECSEAALYKHFASKEEIFVKVLTERLPRFSATIADVSRRVGQDTVAEHLTEVARDAVDFYRHSFPIAASLFSEPTLLEHQRRSVRELGSGPDRPIRALADYLRAERRLGRIPAEVDPDAGAALLIGACFQRGFLEEFAGAAPDEAERAAFTAGLIATLMRGLD